MGGAKKRETVHVPLPACAREWSARERTIIDLHFYYLTNVWSLNDWKVYNRYRKHLPAESRFEVDQLVDLMMKDLPREMRAKLDAIFAVVWDAEDWLAVLASEELAHDLDVDDRNAWRQKVADVMLKLARDGALH
ncbi:MAG TPA: hypothetical protein VMZ53_06595 [Kofleriaceae bacterium]|nr:hypothetical protein [Kofleriaceae bacterium]